MIDLGTPSVTFGDIRADTVDGANQLLADGVAGEAVPSHGNPPDAVSNILSYLIHLQCLKRASFHSDSH